MSKKFTEQEVREWLKKNRPNIELIEYGGNVVKKSKFRCTKDRYEWSTSFASIKNHGTGCPKCAGKARVTEDDVREWLKEHNPDIELVEYGGNVNVKSKFRCKKCGNEWKTLFSVIKRGCGCWVCANKNRSLTVDYINDWLNKNKPYIVLENYSGNTYIKSWFRCKKCGHKWESTFGNIQRKYRSCPKCNKKVRVSVCDVNTWLFENNPDIRLLKYGGNVSDNSVFVCNRCGKVWSASFDHIKYQGTGCPYCVKKYKYDGFYFDSSLEIAFYMYKKFHDKVRLIRNYVKERFLCYGRDGVNRWYYDFYTKNGRKYEVKPENDLYVDCYGLTKEQCAILREQHTESLNTRAKKYANEKYGYGVIFVGCKEINPMKKWLLAHNYNWELYRIGKVEKQKELVNGKA